MKRALLLFSSTLALCAGVMTHAMAEENYYPGVRATTPWYGHIDSARKSTDLHFIAGMRPHHEMALSMSEEYLNDPDAQNAQMKQLARAIFHNQEFEIHMLDTVSHLVKKPGNDSVRQIATKNLAQREKFFRMPIPGPWDRQDGEVANMSARDVRFARAMIHHHQAALEMAQDYLHNPTAHNGYLKRMCLDILVDQSREIMFMNHRIAEYRGNPDFVQPAHHVVHEEVKTETVEPVVATPVTEDAPTEEPAPQQQNGWFNILRKLKGN